MEKQINKKVEHGIEPLGQLKLLYREYTVLRSRSISQNWACFMRAMHGKQNGQRTG